MIIETEDDIKGILNIAFPGSHHTITMILLHEKTIHIFAEKEFIKKESENISKHIKDLKSNFDDVIFHYPNQINLTNPILLKIIKENSPINEDKIKYFLKKQNVDFKEKEFNNKISSLRKRKYIFRLKNKHLTLTLTGIRAVPVSKNRTSSDVIRALVLGRKKW